MKNYQRYSLFVLFAANGISLVYHFLILTQIVPYKYAWGGKLSSLSEMYLFESVSVAITLLAVAMLASYANMIKQLKAKWIYKTVFAVFMVLFALNTLGNLVAETTFESMVFTPITAVSVIAYGILFFTKIPE